MLLGSVTDSAKYQYNSNVQFNSVEFEFEWLFVFEHFISLAERFEANERGRGV